jgi:hypothetical protein
MSIQLNFMSAQDMSHVRPLKYTLKAHPLFVLVPANGRVSTLSFVISQ